MATPFFLGSRKANHVCRSAQTSHLHRRSIGAFCPAALAERRFRALAADAGVPFIIGLERKGDGFSRYETSVLPEGHPQFAENFNYVERLVKFLLWQRGGYRLYLGGTKALGEYIRKQYSPTGGAGLST